MKLDPRKIQSMMNQMGLSQEQIPASKVIIESSDGKIIINNPSVTKIKMHGQESFQISGDIHEEAAKFSEEDIKTIIEKTGCTEKQAEKALEKTGDLAEAIISLTE